MSKVSKLHRKWLKNWEYKLAYQELAPEFELAREVLREGGLLDGYRAMASDREREAEAEEWCEGLISDTGDPLAPKD